LRKRFFTFRMVRVSMAAMIAVIDTNIWGFLGVPIGIAVCFGPALLVWLKEEYFSKPPDGRSDGH
jgi:hypothetical protein